MIINKLKVCITLALCTLSIACVQKQHVSLSKDFTAENIANSGFIIAGITNRSNQVDLASDIRNAKVIHQVFSSKFPQYPIISADQVLKEMGQNLYVQMMDSYRFHGKPRVVFMNDIEKRYITFRYIIYAVIGGDSTRHSMVPMHNNSSENTQQHSLLTQRTMMVSLQIYDLKQHKKLVWASALQDVVENKKMFYGLPAKQVQNNPEWFPNAPGPVVVLEKIFKRFAGSLPSSE